MAIIPKLGILTGDAIEKIHILNIIEALDGTNNVNIIIKGSLSIPGFPNVSSSIAEIRNSSFTSPFTALSISGSWQSQDFANLTPSSISGSFLPPSSSFSTRITTLENNGVFTPASISGSFKELSSSLYGEVQNLQSSLKVLQTQISSSSAIILSQQTRIEALEAQINGEM
tara:strand:+ start:2534 stop:3046 length:513 start_codon:yes stop_codon:yes gene_type:complete